LRRFGNPDITDMGNRTHSEVAVPLLLFWASLSAWGQSAGENLLTPRLAMPEWLAPFPQARGQVATAASTEGASSYTALAHPADVISHYEEQMRAAGVTFSARNDGLGISIVASAKPISAVIRIREAADTSRVNVSYAVVQDKPAAPPPANLEPQTAAPQQPKSTSPGKRAPISPFARVPYTWIMQSTIIRESNPVRYNPFYYEAPTDRTVVAALTLPSRASIVDVFPADCLFSLQDQAGHSLTFKKAEEALGKGLAPGTWSVYPMKCSGIEVFLN
jgi:hypothetical protein